MIAGGGPQKELGGATMDLPVLLAVAKAVTTMKLPYLRFDYSGFGRSRGPASLSIPRDIIAVTKYLLDNLSERLIYIGYSGGAQEGLRMIQGTEVPDVRKKVK